MKRKFVQIAALCLSAVLLALCAAGGVAGKLYLDHNAGSTSSSGQRQDGEARKKEHPYE